MSPSPPTAARSAVRRVLERAGAQVEESAIIEALQAYRGAHHGQRMPEDLQDETESAALALVSLAHFVMSWLPAASGWPAESWGSLMYDLHIGALLGSNLGARYQRIGNEVML